MTAPKTIRDLVRDLSGFDDVDDAIRAVITEDITLLSPGFVLSRESMIEAWRRLSSNDFDIVSDAEFVAWGFQPTGGDPAGDLDVRLDRVLGIIRDAVVALLIR